MAEQAENLQLFDGLERPGDVYSKRLNALILVGLTAAFIVSVLYRPAGANYFTICGFKNITGLPCPGCGLTHSFCAIGKGEMLHAIEFNVFGPFLFALAVLAWIRSMFVLVGRSRPAALFDAWIVRLRLVRNTVIAMIVFGVARIVWLLIYPPGEVQNSPLVRLVAWLKG